MYRPEDHAKEMMRLWTMRIPISDVQPITFSDSLAELFFYDSLCAALNHAYRCGIRAEQKRRKQKAVRKWFKKNQNRRPS